MVGRIILMEKIQLACPSVMTRLQPYLSRHSNEVTTVLKVPHALSQLETTMLKYSESIIY